MISFLPLKTVGAADTRLNCDFSVRAIIGGGAQVWQRQSGSLAGAKFLPTTCAS